MWRRILIVAAAGAALNLLVAWTCALATDVSRGQISELYADVGAEHHWEVYRWDSLAGTRVLSRCWSGIAMGPYNHGDPAGQLPGWCSIETPSGAMPRSCSEVEEGWGLPMRSMGCRFTLKAAADGGADSSKSGVLSLRAAKRVGERSYYLPLTPLWAGLLVNTIVYALVVVAVHGAVRDLRLYCARCRTRSSPMKAMTST